MKCATPVIAVILHSESRHHESHVIQRVPAIQTNRHVSRSVRYGQSNVCVTSKASDNAGDIGRRTYLSNIVGAVSAAAAIIPGRGDRAFAEEEGDGDGDPTYENPNIPAGPEERSGLVILRVAEVAQFQEKILRAILNGDISGFMVSPMQIAFGTQILLKNSNIAGNMKLMIETEVPRQRRPEASANAAKTMNTLQTIYTTADNIKRPFKEEEILYFADLYRDVRVQLNAMYEYLPQGEKDKYYGYFVAVTEYEKKISKGVYNPELDGILKFD